MLFKKYKDSSTPSDRHFGGESIFVAILTCIIISVMGVSLTRLHNASFMSLVSSETSMQAQHFAKSKMDYLMFKGYNNLAMQAKTVINGTTFKDSVALGTITTDADGVKKRTVTVSVYNDDEASPRATLSHVFYSNDADLYVRNGSSPTNSISMHYIDGKLLARVDGVDVELGGGVPVGTIIAWPFNNAPTKGGKWLLCDGSSYSSDTYPELYSVSGSTKVPDLRDRFLQGSSTAGTVIEAGLPNIRGSFFGYDNGSVGGGMGDNSSGAFKTVYQTWYHVYPNDVGYVISVSNTGSVSNDISNFYNMAVSKGFSDYMCDAEAAIAFSANSSNSIYGDDITTVQPPAYTVRYYIKAA